MDKFTFDDELSLLEGIGKGLGTEWRVAEKWIKIHAHGDAIDVLMDPPSAKPLFKMEQLILSEMKKEWLIGAGQVIGFYMSVYLKKQKKHIEAAAL